MDLTLREAATLLGRSPRTLRGQLARGTVPGVKRSGHWMIPSDALPLGEPQRRALQAKADTLRMAVEDVLPSRVATARGVRRRSVADVAAFRLARPMLTELRAAAESGDPGLAPTAAILEQGLLTLAEATHEYDRDRKLRLLQQARGHLGRAVGHLLLAVEDPLADPVAGWLSTLENEAIPALSGLLRWASRLPGRRT